MVSRYQSMIGSHEAGTYLSSSFCYRYNQLPIISSITFLCPTNVQAIHNAIIPTKALHPYDRVLPRELGDRQ
jgi:hypothetical protein